MFLSGDTVLKLDVPIFTVAHIFMEKLQLVHTTTADHQLTLKLTREHLEYSKKVMVEFIAFLTNLYPSLFYCCINLLFCMNQISGDSFSSSIFSDSL